VGGPKGLVAWEVSAPPSCKNGRGGWSQRDKTMLFIDFNLLCFATVRFKRKAFYYLYWSMYRTISGVNKRRDEIWSLQHDFFHPLSVKISVGLSFFPLEKERMIGKTSVYYLLTWNC
jgi:hypothetical protein